MEEKTLATELMAELKKNNKRLFIIAIIEAVIIFVVMYVILTTPYKEITQEADTEGDNASISQSVGE